ncbi:triacylglycerol lipase [Tychonema sp. LEGE 07203]|uniref:esterase/lipase family protein n=1 Tax=Tychonema sp. LEGE 07203 TaxID=1828671 RepID=UPI0018803549|nr:alpha/beta fold hydrolase [Tychonema sp. LEGE 07203]MBE9095844.1 lipase [Tychonema sp. LEGE 07203]
MNSNFSRNPVLLVHGMRDTKLIFSTMSARLTELGWCVHSLNLTPSDGSLGLELLAQQVAGYVCATFAPEQPIDIVGFSMGGIVSRYYIQRLGGINRVQRFIAISSPHNGTWAAYTNGGKGCVQMRPGSAFLKDLNRDAALLEKLNFTSIWTDWDFVILPAASSQMSAAKEVKLSVFTHAMMVRHSSSLKSVAEALSEPLKNYH